MLPFSFSINALSGAFMNVASTLLEDDIWPDFRKEK
jgi:hypothetical protein